MLLTPFDQHVYDVSNALAAIRKRLDALETQAMAVAPLLTNNDRLHVARVCKECGTTLAMVESRNPAPERARAVGAVFAILRKQGWPADRIAKASGYTSRGVTANLKAFAPKP